VHPHNSSSWDKASLDELLAIAKDDLSGVISAIGECGLDYNRNFSPKQIQMECLEAQLELAIEVKKPVFLHERDAFDDFSRILRNYRPSLAGCVVHCFTGDKEALHTYLSMDCYIGITGWLCDERRGAHLIPLLREIPHDRLLLETDSPYLLPRNVPKQARVKSGRNEPCFLPFVTSFAAEILGKSPEDLALETSTNSQRLFSRGSPRQPGAVLYHPR
jgi:TatD DNase family protein